MGPRSPSIGHCFRQKKLLAGCLYPAGMLRRVGPRDLALAVFSPPLAGRFCPVGLERGGAGRGDGMILIAGTTADANGPYYLAIQLQRDAASKNHDFAVV